MGVNRTIVTAIRRTDYDELAVEASRLHKEGIIHSPTPYAVFKHIILKYLEQRRGINKAKAENSDTQQPTP